MIGFVIFIYAGSPLTARYKGAMSPCPVGIPNDACMSLPMTCCISLRDTFDFCSVFDSRFCSFLFLFFGSCTVYLIPSKIQPKISLTCSHVPSPSVSFLMETGSSPLCPEMFGGGNIEWTPCSIARLTCFRWSWVMRFVNPMKSSTYTCTCVVPSVSFVNSSRAFNIFVSRSCSGSSLMLSISA